MNKELANAALVALTLAHAVTDPGGASARGAGNVQPPETSELAGEQDELFVSGTVLRDVSGDDRAGQAPLAPNRFRIVASTEIVDSHGTKLKQNWDLKRYLENNVLQWAHNRSDDRPAIGNVEELKVKAKQLTGVAVFDSTTEFDREILAKYQKGVLRGFSVGFRATKYTIEVIDGEEILVLDELELFEISACNVPSNPQGLTVAESKRNADTLGRMMDRARAARFSERAGAVPFTRHATSTGDWNALLAERRVRAYATTTNGVVDFAKYAEAFAYADPEKRSDPAGYRFLHSDIVDGKLVAVRAGCLEAMRAVAASGLPESDLTAVKRHIADDLNLFGLQPSWARQAANPSTPKPAPTRSTGVQIPMKNVTIDSARATAKGMTCEVACPSCEEKMGLEVKVAPMATEKAAEVDKLSSDLSARTAELATATKDLAEVRTLKGADEARITSLSTDLDKANTEIRAARESMARRDLDALVAADKLPPSELEAELEVSRLYLADSTRDAAGALVGQVKWAARLAKIGERKATGMLSGPVITVDKNAPGGVRSGGGIPGSTVSLTGKDAQGRTVGGQGRASLIIARAEAPAPAL